jgi:hypothetical protein
MDATKITAPKGQEDLKDSHRNFVYAQPDTSNVQSEALSKKELREQKKAAKKNVPKPKELKRISFD